MGFPIPSHSIPSVEGQLSLTENQVPTAGCCQGLRGVSIEGDHHWIG